MNGVASGGVRAVCPECSSVKCLGRSELGQKLTCWDCGTNFVVQRHRRRSRACHRLRTESLPLQWAGTPDAPPEAASRALITILSLLFLAAAGVLMAQHWSEIVNSVRALR